MPRPGGRLSRGGLDGPAKSQFPGDVRRALGLEKRHKILQQTFRLPEPEPEPEPSLIDDADPIDMDDLDTPAYLRQGKLPG